MSATAESERLRAVMATLRTSAGDRVLSPELALVDPVLAAEARASLVVRDCLAPAVRPPVATADGVGPVRATRPGTRDRPRASRGTLAGLAVGIVLGAVAGGLLGRSPAASEDSRAAPARTATAPAPAAARPKDVSVAAEPLHFSWAPADGITAYEVEFFRGGEQVLRRRTRVPELDLGPTWMHDGALVTRLPGTYRWYVWAVRNGVRDTRALVSSSIVVART